MRNSGIFKNPLQRALEFPLAHGPGQVALAVAAQRAANPPNLQPREHKGQQAQLPIARIELIHRLSLLDQQLESDKKKEGPPTGPPIARRVPGFPPGIQQFLSHEMNFIVRTGTVWGITLTKPKLEANNPQPEQGRASM